MRSGGRGGLFYGHCLDPHDPGSVPIHTESGRFRPDQSDLDGSVRVRRVSTFFTVNTIDNPLVLGDDLLEPDNLLKIRGVCLASQTLYLEKLCRSCGPIHTLIVCRHRRDANRFHNPCVSQGGRAANQWVLPHRFENPLPLVARLCQKLNDP